MDAQHPEKLAWQSQFPASISASQFGSALGFRGLVRHYVDSRRAPCMPQSTDNACTRHGILTEPKSRALYEMLLGKHVYNGGFFHTENNILGCSPDGQIYDDDDDDRNDCSTANRSSRTLNEMSRAREQSMTPKRAEAGYRTRTSSNTHTDTAVHADADAAAAAANHSDAQISQEVKPALSVTRAQSTQSSCTGPIGTHTLPVAAADARETCDANRRQDACCAKCSACSCENCSCATTQMNMIATNAAAVLASAASAAAAAASAAASAASAASAAAAALQATLSISANSCSSSVSRSHYSMERCAGHKRGCCKCCPMSVDGCSLSTSTSPYSSSTTQRYSMEHAGVVGQSEQPSEEGRAASQALVHDVHGTWSEVRIPGNNLTWMSSPSVMSACVEPDNALSAHSHTSPRARLMPFSSPSPCPVTDVTSEFYCAATATAAEATPLLHTSEANAQLCEDAGHSVATNLVSDTLPCSSTYTISTAPLTSGTREDDTKPPKKAGHANHRGSASARAPSTQNHFLQRTRHGKPSRLLEIKSPFCSLYTTKKTDCTIYGIPLEYMCQVQGQLSITGVEECDFFIYLDKPPKCEVAAWRVCRSADFWDWAEPVLHFVSQCIQNGWPDECSDEFEHPSFDMRRIRVMPLLYPFSLTKGEMVSLERYADFFKPLKSLYMPQQDVLIYNNDKECAAIAKMTCSPVVQFLFAHTCESAEGSITTAPVTANHRASSCHNEQCDACAEGARCVDQQPSATGVVHRHGAPGSSRSLSLATCERKHQWRRRQVFLSCLDDKRIIDILKMYAPKRQHSHTMATRESGDAVDGRHTTHGTNPVRSRCPRRVPICRRDSDENKKQESGQTHHETREAKSITNSCGDAMTLLEVTCPLSWDDGFIEVEIVCMRDRTYAAQHEVEGIIPVPASCREFWNGLVKVKGKTQA